MSIIPRFYSSYDIILKSHFCRKNFISLSLCAHCCYGRHNAQGDISFKSSYLLEFFPVLTKIILSRERIVLATLLYEHFIHLT